jgi:two-component system copper resistance phosphate regulon response regulator CusR
MERASAASSLAAGVSVLVIEDETKTRDSIVQTLQFEGWAVRAAKTGNEAIAQLDAGPFDLLIVDWMLPGCDGLSVVERARLAVPAPRVLMLTARASLDDRITGLESGADDYLVKPFALAELVARCRALLRRPLASDRPLLIYGDLRLDTRARVATRAGRKIPLTPREVDVLEYLLLYQDQIVTRSMLERDIWKQTRRFTSLDNVIEVQILRLRRKVDGPGETRLIQTLRGRGYRLGGEGE